ncbi:unnamed protein product [Sphenostylis stenocarpa]|uniref:Protein kinase domain-containing protein n=1 Tax=Sphenostylis stenocarpa TaxID=92480 RepID=A0AA86RWB5_9FABA|nr:unnamed protein product [Sphenostylis stenocarpa]
MRSVEESNEIEYNVEGLQIFSLAELVAATNNFSIHNKIGAGSFGVVYRAKLVDGCEVAIKRDQTWPERKIETKFELTLLSRLRYKNVVELIGFCEKKDERVLVYEEWIIVRSYAWQEQRGEGSARVSGFGFLLYSFGVVLLELLMGKTADDFSLFHGKGGSNRPLSVVEFAVPAIMDGHLVEILDSRVGLPDVNEAEALQLLAYTAVNCVTRKGKDRPTMAENDMFRKPIKIARFNFEGEPLELSDAATTAKAKTNLIHLALLGNFSTPSLGLTCAFAALCLFHIEGVMDLQSFNKDHTYPYILSLAKNQMGDEIFESIEMSYMTVDATSYSWILDRAIRSDTDSSLGASPVHSFSSVVDCAIRSRTPLTELVAATNNFSLHNKIGAGSFGAVYGAKLVDDREVAVKRGEAWPKRKIKIKSELTFLSRLHHKHLVGLVGFCEEKDERLLVYEYMKNGALYDHLHDKNNVEKGSSVLNYWKMRIKIALDAARGIEYLHNYAVPSIIHRDIKSSNILIDATWTARVSDFGLSLMSPEPDHDYRPMKVAGTLGYIDPEYYGLNVLTTKSDVYGLGIVLLELLTGKRAIFKYDEDGGTPLSGTPLSVVDFAVPPILAGELVKILDPRVGPPDVTEAEAVELVAYTAIHCVNLEGKDRPTMADIVVNLERTLAICESSHDSISSDTIHCVNLEGKDSPTMADTVVNLERDLATSETRHDNISRGLISCFDLDESKTSMKR